MGHRAWHGLAGWGPRPPRGEAAGVRESVMHVVSPITHPEQPLSQTVEPPGPGRLRHYPGRFRST